MKAQGFQMRAASASLAAIKSLLWNQSCASLEVLSPVSERFSVSSDWCTKMFSYPLRLRGLFSKDVLV